MNNFDNSHSFSDSREEFEYYKCNYYKKKEELSKCFKKIKKLESFNNKLLQQLNNKNFIKISKIENIVKKNEKKSNNISKDSNSSNSNTKKNNNTNAHSTKVISLNEFRTLWESIIQTELIENFDFCINEYILISYLCQDMVLLIYNESQNEIINKLNQVLKCLNLDKISKNKFNIIYEEFLPFFQEHMNIIFICQDSFLEIIHCKLISITKEYDYNNLKVKTNINSSKLSNKSITNENNFCNEMPILLEKKIINGHFDKLIKNFYKICIYMLLHDPILSFNIEKYSERTTLYQYYNKNNFINVEGFGNEKSPCILLLSPPLLKEKFPFYGLRAAVYIISEPDKNIFSECEINKEKNNEENKNITFSDKSEKKTSNEPQFIEIKNNRVIKSSIRNNNKRKLKNQKKSKTENYNMFDSFNCSFNFINNKSNNNSNRINNQKYIHIKNEKFIMNNLLGDFFIKNNNKNNNEIDYNEEYQNNKNGKDNTSNNYPFSLSKNFLSSNQNLSSRKLILSNNNGIKGSNSYSLFNNYKNEYNINNIKTSNQNIKNNNLYKNKSKESNIDLRQEILNNKNRNNINNNLYEKNNKHKNSNIKQIKKREINNSNKDKIQIKNKNDINNYQYDAFSTIKTPEKFHFQYNSDIKSKMKSKDINNQKNNNYSSSNYTIRNKLNKINRNKNYNIKKLEENRSLDNNPDNYEYYNNDNYMLDLLNLNNEHIYINSLLESSNSKYNITNLSPEIKNMNDSNNFNRYKTINKNINQNNPKNIKFNRQTSYTSRERSFNNNSKNRNNKYLINSKNKLEQNENEQESEINILYIKKNENIKANNIKNININKNKKFFKKISPNKNYSNVKIFKNNNIGVNGKKINNIYINKNQINKEFYIIKKNNGNNANNKIQKINKNKNDCNQRFLNDNNTNENNNNSNHDIFYLNNNKKKESRTIDNDKLYINKNISYNNIFYNKVKNNYNFNSLYDDSQEKKIMNYSNLFDSNLYKKSKIYIINGDDKSGFNLNNFNKLQRYNNNNNLINSSFPDLNSQEYIE